jgi:hypothetical protein
MGSIEQHSALERAGAEIERTVLTVIFDFDKVIIPEAAIYHLAGVFRHIINKVKNMVDYLNYSFHAENVI